MPTGLTPLLFLLLLLLILLAVPSISGDEEEDEDESWKNWIISKPKPDFGKFEEMDAKRHVGVGPGIGFVKLRFGVKRTEESVSDMAMKWTRMLKQGGVEIKFMGIDLNTIMFTLEKPQYVEDFKYFLLDQPDAYEVKIADQVYRRPGDPPLEEVIKMLRSEKNKPSKGIFKSEETHKEL